MAFVLFYNESNFIIRIAVTRMSDLCFLRKLFTNQGLMYDLPRIVNPLGNINQAFLGIKRRNDLLQNEKNDIAGRKLEIYSNFGIVEPQLPKVGIFMLYRPGMMYNFK